MSLRVTKNLLELFTFLSIGLSSFVQAAANDVLVPAHSEPIDQNWLSSDNTKSIGQAKLSSGVTHSSVKDQKSGEICWSYTLSALAETEYRKAAIQQGLSQVPTDQQDATKSKWLKDVRHHTVHVSPEYLQFWHIYYQIETQLPNYLKIANSKSGGDPDLAKKLAEVIQSGRKKYILICALVAAADGNNGENDIDSTVDVGNDENVALEEAKRFGMIPNSYWENLTPDHTDISVGTDAQETLIEKNIPDFIHKVLLDPAHIKIYMQDSTANQDHIRMSLYRDLNDYFRVALGIDRIGPDSKFSFTQHFVLLLQSQLYTDFLFEVSALFPG